MIDPVHLALLGNLRIRSGNASPSVRGQAAELLGLLAVEQALGGNGDRERLAGLLSPDLPQAEARRHLAVILFKLRKALGPLSRILLATPAMLSLQGCIIDAEAVEQELPNASPSRRIEILESYKGDLLETFSAEWLDAPRARWRSACLGAMPALMHHLEQLGDVTGALHWAARWQTLDPLDGAACLARMRLLWQRDQHAEALRRYDDYAGIMRRELNAEPDAELRSLARAIDQDREAQAAQEQSRLMLGRADERAALLRGLSEHAPPAVWLVNGDAGMGKTTLLDDLAGAVKWRGMIVARGAASNLGGMTAGAPLSDALARVLTPAMQDRLGMAMGKAAWEVVLDTLPQLAPATTNPARERRPASLPMVFRALLQALTRLQPVAVLLDDVHWADPDFFNLLPQLIDLMQHAPLRLVLSARQPELIENTPAWDALKQLDAGGHLQRVVLHPLTGQHTRQMAQTLSPALTPEAVQDIHRRSAGNPLVIKTLLLAQAGDSTPLNQISDVYARRLMPLSSAPRHALIVAALFSRAVRLEEWAMACDSTAGVPLDALLGSGLMTEVDAGFALQHDLLRAHLIDVIPPGQRARIHARIAAVLNERNAPAAEVAAHFEQASMWAQACQHLCRAADEAMRVSAIANATALAARIEQAIRRGNLGEREKLLARHLRLCLALARAWSDDDQAEAEALTLDAKAQGDWLTAIAAMRTQFKYLATAGKFDVLRDMGNEAVELAERAGAPRAAVEVRNDVAQLVAVYQMNIALGLELLADAEARATSLMDGSPASAALRADVLLSRVSMYFRSAELMKAGETLREIDALREQFPGMPMNDLLYLGAHGYAAQSADDYERALDCHRQRAAQAALRGDGPQQIIALQNAGHVARIVGQMGEAAMHNAALVQLATERKDARVLTFRCGLADALLEADDAEGASDVLQPVEAWLAEAPRTGMAAFQAGISMATLRHQQGRHDESPVYLRSVLALERARGTLTYMPQLIYARFAMTAGHADEARAMFEMARPQIQLNRAATDVAYFHWVDHVVNGQPMALARARDTLFQMGYRMMRREYRRDAVINRRMGREIAQAWDALRGPARVARSFARWEMPAARPAHGPARVEVACTVDDGLLDAEIATQGKVALRQHRLKRIALEANLCSAAATHDELAGLLGVTLRTVERDVQALASAGITLFTRRVAGQPVALAA